VHRSSHCNFRSICKRQTRKYFRVLATSKSQRVAQPHLSHPGHHRHQLTCRSIALIVSFLHCAAACSLAVPSMHCTAACALTFLTMGLLLHSACTDCLQQVTLWLGMSAHKLLCSEGCWTAACGIILFSSDTVVNACCAGSAGQFVCSALIPKADVIGSCARISER
jgi:hypothetical protein